MNLLPSAATLLVVAMVLADICVGEERPVMRAPKKRRLTIQAGTTYHVEEHLDDDEHGGPTEAGNKAKTSSHQEIVGKLLPQLPTSFSRFGLNEEAQASYHSRTEGGSHFKINVHGKTDKDGNFGMNSSGETGHWNSHSQEAKNNKRMAGWQETYNSGRAQPGTVIYVQGGAGGAGGTGGAGGSATVVRGGIGGPGGAGGKGGAGGSTSVSGVGPIFTQGGSGGPGGAGGTYGGSGGAGGSTSVSGVGPIFTQGGSGGPGGAGGVYGGNGGAGGSTAVNGRLHYPDQSGGTGGIKIPVNPGVGANGGTNNLNINVRLNSNLGSQINAPINTGNGGNTGGQVIVPINTGKEGTKNTNQQQGSGETNIKNVYTNREQNVGGTTQYIINNINGGPKTDVIYNKPKPGGTTQIDYVIDRNRGNVDNTDVIYGRPKPGGITQIDYIVNENGGKGITDVIYDESRPGGTTQIDYVENGGEGTDYIILNDRHRMPSTTYVVKGRRDNLGSTYIVPGDRPGGSGPGQTDIVVEGGGPNGRKVTVADIFRKGGGGPIISGTINVGGMKLPNVSGGGRVSGKVCVDTLSHQDCQKYNLMGLCWTDGQTGYMQNYCPQTCGFCGCQDKAGDCATYAQQGYCKNPAKRDTMLQMCQMSCLECHCIDQADDCDRYKNHCATNDVVSKRCRSTCNSCFI